MNTLVDHAAVLRRTVCRIPRRRVGAVLFLAVSGIVLLTVPRVALGQIEFEREPINYGTAPARDPVAILQQQLAEGQAHLDYDAKHGYLASVLKRLDIPTSSQVLVYSKTSLQLRRISPQTPRAIYFNDETYVGWVPHGDVIEVMSTDPAQGEIFYTLSQERIDKPVFARDRGHCMACHATSRTQGVPGVLVRSVFVDGDGQPRLTSGTFVNDHASPFTERWGGWYVTGTHGSMRHMGNQIARSSRDTEDVERERGSNVTDLSNRFDISAYLTTSSDIVALMVLEHQSQMHNFLTAANFECRSATYHDGIMSSALGRPAQYVSETTQRRVASAGEKLLRYMLYADEFQLTSPVRGTSNFATEFQSRGPRDRQGRSLRDFDLNTRMFKYPCSYLIYSPSFDSLPDPVKSHVLNRLHRILTGQDTDAAFAHLSSDDRAAILQILCETKPGPWNH